VSRVIEFAPNEIEAPPAFGTRVKIEYLLGLGAIGKKFCQILDIDKVLSADELLAVGTAQAEASEEETPEGTKGV
jgi:purine-binding chemotaxis protein CheW